MRNKKSRNLVPAKKNLGQHFLIDQSVIEQITTAIDIKEDEQVLEIGPGLGALTMPLLEKYQRLTAIEVDSRVIPILYDKAKNLGNLTIINQDILDVNFKTIIDPKKVYKCFGNLPYNISTPILFALTQIDSITEMVFMLQKEVVDRMVASPNTKAYGRLSIILQQTHRIVALFDVYPESFSPPPKVESSVVKLIKRPSLRWPVDDINLFSKIVKTAFSMRRKTLRNNLKSQISEQQLLALNIDPKKRAEQLTGNDFANITNFLSQNGECK